MHPDAILFDLDDTILASRPLWERAEMQMAALIGVVWSAELQSQCQGKGVDDVAGTLHKAGNGRLSLEIVRTEFRDLLTKAFRDGPIREMPGAAACCGRLSARLPLAVASGSSLPLIRVALHELGITKCFSVVVSSESVDRGKPAPDIFLAAANALGVEPRGCIVVEDSVPGVLAAKAANMTCIALTGEGTIPETIAQKADRMIISLADLDSAIQSIPDARQQTPS